MYDIHASTRKLKERILNSEEDEEESENAILIIKRQEIEAKIIDSDASISSDEEVTWINRLFKLNLPEKTH